MSFERGLQVVNECCQCYPHPVSVRIVSVFEFPIVPPLLLHTCIIVVSLCSGILIMHGDLNMNACVNTCTVVSFLATCMWGLQCVDLQPATPPYSEYSKEHAIARHISFSVSIQGYSMTVVHALSGCDIGNCVGSVHWCGHSLKLNTLPPGCIWPSLHVCCQHDFFLKEKIPDESLSKFDGLLPV